ncbi:hypothetical protein DDE18_16265 [Nocardioides gansuensis]|uniref:Uncharacterized protein n=1 Tax=Nocardioides gansuensis TaxID=2138300 RepID=A0A2T8F776_9ACTN|nr:TasA family protein [Nocardioides gansuensis]PVG81563.1 hypothetical protein DDE18_16265 [Nocardioides gansuensis]
MHTTSDTTRRKVLVPLATLLVAGAVAIGSGATFTSTSTTATAVTSGTLTHANSKNEQTLTIDDIKPGDVKTGTLTITNDGTLDSELALTELVDGTNTFETGVLDLKITSRIDDAATTTVVNDEFGALPDGTPVVIGDLPVDSVATLTFTVSLDASAGNANQGKSASATFSWVTTQKNDSSTVAWLPFA